MSKKIEHILLSITNSLKKGNYIFGAQGAISMLVPYFIVLQYSDTTEALISALVGLFMFVEHKNFGFKRRIAQSLAIVGTQIILLVLISTFFRQHYYCAIIFHFILFFSLNYYNYFETPNTIKLFSIQYFYIISLTTDIGDNEIYLRVSAIVIALITSAIGLLILWPTKTHSNLEKRISKYLSNTKNILTQNIEEYKLVSSEFKQKQSLLLSEIMNVLYSLKYGNIFSTTKGKYLFKITVNTQILNNSLHYLKKSKELKEYKVDDNFFELSEKWKDSLIEVISLLEKTVLENKHSLLLIENKYFELNKLTLELHDLLVEKKSKKLRIRIDEIDYLIKTLIDFSKRLILYNHKTEDVINDKFNFLYRFDNFKNNILKSLSFKQAPFRFAFQMSLLLTISLLLVAYFDIFEGFWIPMTILIIMKPNHGSTKTQTYNRIWGTLVGLIISFVLIEGFPSIFIIPSIVFAVYMAIVFIKPNYGFAVVFITMSVVLLMALDFEANDIFILRLVFTMVTAIFVLITNSLLFPNWSKYEIKSKIIGTLKDDLVVIKTILEKASKKTINKDDARHGLLNSYQGREQIFKLYNQMKSEPKSHQLNANIGMQFLIAHERFSENYSRFIYSVLTKKIDVDLPYNLIKASYTTAIKGIIQNLELKKKASKINDDILHKTHTLLIDFSLNNDLNDEQQLLVYDLRKITKRLLELSSLSENNDLVFTN